MAPPEIRPPLVVGNWKMNGLREEGSELARALGERVRSEGTAGVTVGVCPPATLLAPVAEILVGSDVLLGGQDCHPEMAGAHTGDISPAMLADLGCRLVIVGHSERRADHGETDELVRAKAEAAATAGLNPIVCVGESEEERERGETFARIEAQIRGSVPEGVAAMGVVVAYEPVWAIGSGRTPSPEDVAAVHSHIRRLLREGWSDGASIPVLYGGSVKAANAAELIAAEGVDGFLVGGASLKADEFWAICRSAAARG